MPPVKAFDVSFAGIRVRLNRPFPIRLLWQTRKLRPRGTPALSVQFVTNFRTLQKSKSIFHCREFAVDLATRTLYYRRNSPRTYAKRNRGTIHNLLQRSIIFALAVLDELNGPDLSSKRPLVLYLHASSVATRKGALVFCGESTFGKSTISGKLLRDFPKLEDDQALMFVWPGARRRPAIAMLSADFAALKKKCRFPVQDGTVPIAGWFWLKKGPGFTLEPIGTAEAVSLVLYPVACWRRKQAVLNRLKVVTELSKSLPMKRLEFRKEASPLIEMLKAQSHI